MSNKENKNKHNNQQVDNDTQAQMEAEPEIIDVADMSDDEDDSVVDGVSEVEVLKNQLNEAQEKIEKEKKEYMFLLADFDNFRKRVVKEKAELVKNASEQALKDLLPIVDDFERGLNAVTSTESGEAVAEGMRLIYNKLVKYLADHGVKAMESTGADFDADNHDAIATIPAPSAELKGKVIDTTTKGYTINDKVLRHAKVVVGE